MAEPSRRIIRDVLIVICVIALAILLRLLIKAESKPSPPVNLGDDIAGIEAPRGMMHNAQLFPEDDDAIVAMAMGAEVTRGELHRKANRILGPMAGGAMQIDDLVKIRDDLMLQALGELLTEVFIYRKCIELGIDVDGLGEKALAEWAKGYDSPEAKLADIGQPGITIDDMRRLLTKETIVEMLERQVTGEMGEATDEEREAFFKSWLASEMASLEVDFTDGELERIWSEYVDALTKSLEEGKENTQDDSEIG